MLLAPDSPFSRGSVRKVETLSDDLWWCSECLDGKASTGWSVAVGAGVLITRHTANLCRSCMGMFKDHAVELHQKKVTCMRTRYLMVLLDPSENCEVESSRLFLISALSCRTATLTQVIKVSCTKTVSWNRKLVHIWLFLALCWSLLPKATWRHY